MLVWGVPFFGVPFFWQQIKHFRKEAKVMLTMLNISCIETNSFLSYNFPALEFLNSLVIRERELSFL